MLTPLECTQFKNNKINPVADLINDDFNRTISHARLVATEVYYKKKREIYGEGEPSEYVYQILCGGVGLYKTLVDGRRQISAFYLPGDVFGLESGPSHRMTAEAIAHTTVRLVKRLSLQHAAATSAQVALGLWAIAAAELRHAEDHLLLLGQKTAMERVASFLIEMDRRLPVGVMIALPMTRRDISDYLGITIETVSRALAQLHDDGLIELSGDGNREIVIQDRNRLRDVDASTRYRYYGCRGLKEPLEQRAAN